jgi:hypothetical protein
MSGAVRALVTSVAATLACLLAVPAAGWAQEPPRDVLPNLVQAAPSAIGVQTAFVDGRTVFRLGFDSATENRGAGPLSVRGFRTSGAVPTMQVDQLVARSDGSVRTVPGIGLMRYVVHQDHQHWHFLRFARYKLVPVDRRGRRRDRKTGFCLGDRYRISGAVGLSGYSPIPAFQSRCGLRRPDLLEMLEGISTGYGDNYAAHLEGQYVDITGLRAGRYRLVHTANPTDALVETDYRDNDSSALLRIRWPHGERSQPRVKVLRACDALGRCG